MDHVDWRTHDTRQKVIDKIMETLEKHFPFSGPEGINELRRIAARFEEKIFSRAVSQTDYLEKISMKMLTIETKSQKASSIPAASSSIFGHPMDHASSMPPSLVIEEPAALHMGHHMDNVNVPSLVKEEPLANIGYYMDNVNPMPSFVREEHVANIGYYMDNVDPVLTMEAQINATAGSSSSIPAANKDLIGGWRIHLPPLSRQENARKIMESLRKHVPNSGEEELMRTAVSFEELIYMSATNQADYFRKISFKMQIVEEGRD